MVAAGLPPRAAYLDASALLKLIVPERESLALRTALLEQDWQVIVSSALVRTEVPRAVAIVDQSSETARVATTLVATIALLDVSAEVLDAAAAVEPPVVRSLDAIHIATAARAAARREPLLPAGITALVTYDKHMFHAWQDAHTVPVRAPGAPLDHER